MILKKTAIFFCFISTFTALAVSNSYITYYDGGRLGDRLISWVRAQYLSEKYSIPIAYHPFQHSDKLTLSRADTKLTSQLKQKLKHKVIGENTNQLKNPQNNTLYRAKYIGELCIREGLVEYCWKNNHFLQKIKSLIKSITPVAKLSIPHNQVTVAVHVRKGCTTDGPLLSEQIYTSTLKSDRTRSDKGENARKMPPEQYYIDHIALLSNLLDNPPMYVYIFTDYKNPPELTKRFKKYVHKNNITFASRGPRLDCSNQNSILLDLFNMTQFDILIRPDSNFSLIAQIIGNHQVSFRPHTFHWEDKRLIIDESVCLTRFNSQITSYQLPKDREILKQDLLRHMNK